MALAMSSRAAPPQRLTAAPRARARQLPRCALRTAAMTAPLQDLRKGALGAGGAAIGSYVCVRAPPLSGDVATVCAC